MIPKEAALSGDDCFGPPPYERYIRNKRPVLEPITVKYWLSSLVRLLRCSNEMSYYVHRPHCAICQPRVIGDAMCYVYLH